MVGTGVGTTVGSGVGGVGLARNPDALKGGEKCRKVSYTPSTVSKNVLYALLLEYVVCRMYSTPYT